MNKTDQLVAFAVNAGMSEEQGRDFVVGLRDMVWLLASIMEANEESPNFITITMATPGDADYELTIRKHGGFTPAARIATLEAECERLRAEVLRCSSIVANEAPGAAPSGTRGRADSAKTAGNAGRGAKSDEVG